MHKCTTEDHLCVFLALKATIKSSQILIKYSENIKPKKEKKPNMMT